MKNNILLLVFIALFLFSCKSEEKNKDFWIIYEWFYKEKSLDKKIEEDNSKIVVDKNEKIKKYLIDNFKKEKGIGTEWFFKYQTFEVKTTSFKGGIIEIVSCFNIKNEDLYVIDRYFYSLSLSKPKYIESVIYNDHSEKTGSYKSIWNKKISVYE